MAKPPSGKNPTATPTSKPGAQGVPQPAKPATPATGAAPVAKALGDFDRKSGGGAPRPLALPRSRRRHSRQADDRHAHRPHQGGRAVGHREAPRRAPLQQACRSPSHAAPAPALAAAGIK
jgi:hypothetical protein